MRFRRGCVSYLLWALYGLTVCAALTLQVRDVCRLLGQEGEDWYLLLAAGCVLFLFFLLFLPGRLLAGRNGKREEKKEHPGKRKKRRFGYMDAAYLLFAAAACLALRLWGTETSGFLLPLAESLGIALLYPALCFLAGRIPAVTVTLVLAVLPVICGERGAGGRPGILITGAAVLLLFSFLYLEALSGRKRGLAAWAALFGLPAGAAVFLDPAFFSFLLFAASASVRIILKEDPGSEEKKRRRKQRGGTPARKDQAGRPGDASRRASGICVLLLSAAAGWGILCALSLRISGTAAAGMPVEGFDAANLLSGILPFWSGLSPVPAAGLPAGFFAACCCVFYIFGFFDQRGNRGCVWLASFLFSVFLCPQGEYADMAALLFWLIMAGMGIDCIFLQDRQERPADRKKTDPAEEGPGAAAPKRELLPGEPIPSPLPGPKRHVARQMDYAYEPGEDEMFFDIDQVEDGDDFDYH